MEEFEKIHNEINNIQLDRMTKINETEIRFKKLEENFKILKEDLKEELKNQDFQFNKRINDITESLQKQINAIQPINVKTDYVSTIEIFSFLKKWFKK